MTRWKIELRLPILTIGAEDIQIKFRRNRKAAGPYLIISRACGLALDTGNQSEPGNWTILWSPHAERQQLWYLRPTGVIGEFAVVSADNGLALDATRETIGDIHPVMSEVKDEVWQRWRLEDAPDGAAYLLQSAHSRRFMTVNHDAGQTWSRSQLRGGLTCVVAGA
jgi:hypothetical protein